MLKKIVLIGAGGFGREVANIIEVINIVEPTYDLLGFLDDDEKQFPVGTMINGHPVLGKKEWILDHKEDVWCNCTVATPHTKAVIQRSLEAQGVKFETIIAYGGYVAPYTEVGAGCVIYGGVTVAVNSKVGDGVLLNQYVGIGHDVEIGDFTTIMPKSGVSGYCKVGPEVSMGAHVFIVQGRKIGAGATIAAGSIVFSNVKEGTTVLGNPAKRVEALE